MTTMEMACEEREGFADFLDELSPAQWEHPSLCELWRVHDVVAHVISYDELTRAQLVWRFVRGGLIPKRANAIGVAEYAVRSPAQLTELMRARIPPLPRHSARGHRPRLEPWRRPRGQWSWRSAADGDCQTA